MLLQTSNLTKWYNDKILDQVHLTMRSGEILSLIGPSGSGKTTLLKCIAGLEQPDQGTIMLKGKDITLHRADERPVVMMFQQPLLFPHMTVMENILYGPRARGEDKKKIQAAGEEMLQKIELPGYGRRYPYELSGGQQQRVALARALIMKPQLLLLDEPFASLDHELRGIIRSWVRKLLKAERVAGIFVTHDREEAMIMGDRLSVIIGGRLLQQGRPIEVYEKPVNRSVAELFSDGLVLDESRFVPAGKLFLSSMEPDGKEGECLSFYGKILGKWIKAGQYMYQVDLPELTKEMVIPSARDFQLDQPIFLFFARSDIYFFPNKSDRS